MSGRSSYSDEDKAVVYANLVGNGWNVKRTHRETGFPEQTIRNWAKTWKKGDGKPSANAVEAAVTDFLNDATRMRDKLLISLEHDLDAGKMKPGEKITAMGVLDDKIARMQGIVRKDSSTNINIQLPSAQDLIEGLRNMAMSAQNSVLERHLEIIDAEIVEQPKGLPA